MNCEEAKTYLSYYIDDMLDDTERAALQAHLDECPSCRQELADLQEVVSLLRGMEEIPLPDDFAAQLRTRLEAVEREKDIVYPAPVVPLWRRIARNKWVSRTIAACLLVIVGAGMVVFLQSNFRMGSAAPSSDGAASTDMAETSNYTNSSKPMQEQMSGMSEDAATSEGASTGAQGDYAPRSLMSAENDAAKDAVVSENSTARRIIYTTYLEMQVAAMDDAISQAAEIVEEQGGYVISSSCNENQDGTRQWGQMTLRIPIDQYDDTVEALSTLGQVKSSSKTGQDVTQEYYDIQSRLKQYRSQEARYMELIEQAANVSEVLQVENELNQVRAEIESMEGRIQYLSQLSDYGTVELSLQSELLEGNEISLISWQGMGNKLSNAFTSSINGILYGVSQFLVALVAILPVAVPVAAIAILIIYFIRKKKKNLK